MRTKKMMIVGILMAVAGAAQAATITFDDGSQVEFPDDWLVSIDITAQQPCDAPPPTCQDDPRRCTGEELCRVWPDNAKCNIQQPWPIPPPVPLCEREPNNPKCARQQDLLWER
jgi:hypothetical protein